ncbi:MAG TPA: helix-turn-helix transcriptional regulator [Actinomycetota bacterium]|nr:helix-turn-helix transcriptional regulator [Actinomycetota bacterium]
MLAAVDSRDEGSLKGLGSFIRSQRRLANMSLRQLERLTQVSNPYLSQIERGIYRPSAQVLKSIAEALQISAETLYARAGLMEQRPEPAAAGVEQAIAADERLTDDQKEALLGVYRGFVAKTDHPR